MTGLFAVAEPVFISGGLVASRIGALLVASPIFGARSIPTRIKAALVLVLTGVVLSVYGPIADTGAMPVTAMSELRFLVPAVIKELMAGALMGFAATVTVAAARMAGELSGLQMGFSMANVVDPTSNQQVGLIGQLMHMMAILIFLAANGHLFMLQALFDSFAAMSPGAPIPMSGSILEILMGLGGTLFVTGIQLALPAVAVVMLTNVGLALMMRAVPQINIFGVGFILTIGLGFFALLIALGVMGTAFGELAREIFSAMLELARAMGV